MGKQNFLEKFREKTLFVLIGIIIALFIVLLPLTWGMNQNEEIIYEDTIELEDLDEWFPGKLTDDGLSQVMPEIEEKGSHERFKELAKDYGLNPGNIWEVENKYNLREGVVLCLVIAETSGGKKGYGVDGCWNYGNVGNNDRGNRVCYKSDIEGLSAIGRALSNQYLGKIQTLGCLSNAGSCTRWEDFSSRYATSNGNRERTMLNCLNAIYEEELGKIEPERFNVRRVFTIYQ